MISKWGRVRFEAGWSWKLNSFNDTSGADVEGVACPVAACHHDCYGDNFDVIKYWNTYRSYDESKTVDEDGIDDLEHSATDPSAYGVENGDGTTTEASTYDGDNSFRVRSSWIIGRIYVLPRMRRDGTATKRFVYFPGSPLDLS